MKGGKGQKIGGKKIGLLWWPAAGTDGAGRIGGWFKRGAAAAGHLILRTQHFAAKATLAIIS